MVTLRSAFVALVLLVATSVNAAHTTTPAQEVTAVKAETAKSPLTIKVEQETGRILKGKPVDGVSLDYLAEVGYNFWSDLVLSTRLLATSKFATKADFTLLDPSILLTDPSLVTISDVDVNIASQLRVFLPVSEASLDKENHSGHHNGAYRAVVIASKEIGRWGFEGATFGQLYTPHNERDALGTAQRRVRLGNSLSAEYKLIDKVALGTAVEFDNFWMTANDETASEMRIRPSVTVSPTEKLALTAGVEAKLPGMAVQKFTDDVRGNTTPSLNVSYRF